MEDWEIVENAAVAGFSSAEIEDSMSPSTLLLSLPSPCSPVSPVYNASPRLEVQDDTDIYSDMRMTFDPDDRGSFLAFAAPAPELIDSDSAGDSIPLTVRASTDHSPLVACPVAHSTASRSSGTPAPVAVVIALRPADPTPVNKAEKKGRGKAGDHSNIAHLRQCGTEACIKKKPSRLPDAAVGALKQWLAEQLDKPYPSREEKAELSKKTGLSVAQVNNWFINARRRFVKPMLAARSGDRRRVVVGGMVSPLDVEDEEEEDAEEGEEEEEEDNDDGDYVVFA